MFFLSNKFLPKGFKYPEVYVKFANGVIPDLNPWGYYYDNPKPKLHGLTDLEFHLEGLKKRYPKRKLVPFARRGDNDDVACFDASVPSDDPSVIIIHDWASPGWENHGEFENFLEWLAFAKEQAKEWKELPKLFKERTGQLSKTISYALRHAPWEYELELDDEGWVPVEELLSALRPEKEKWRDLTIYDLETVINYSSKQRHEIKEGKIRALYGHSTPQKLIKKEARPPEILYHGTSPKIAEKIFKEGLKPMNRHYVHLSIDIETAKQVGHRKCKVQEILVVQAKKAHHNGIKFYVGNEHVWLADYVPVEYIEKLSA